MQRVCISLLFLLVVADYASGQNTLHVVPGSSPGQRLGRVFAAGDVNNDGRPDFILASPMDGTMGAEAGWARVVSGADWSTLMEAWGDAPGDRLGWSADGAGDVNADGWNDVVLGAPGTPGSSAPGYVRVLSGQDGSVLLTVTGSQPDGRFGQAVSGVGDHDGDGLDDLLVGAPGEDHGATDAGAAYVLSGADGLSLHELSGQDGGDGFGFSADGGMPDVFGADMDPIVVIGASQGASGGPGYVHVYDRADMSLRHQIAGSPSLGDVGKLVGNAGDLDGDGVMDYLLTTTAPAVVLYSGATHQVLHTIAHGTAELSASMMGDVDLDGFDDVAISTAGSGAAGPGGGRVYVHSGLDGSLLNELQSPEGSELGATLAGVGDLDNDELPDLVLADPADDAQGQDAGKVIVVSMNPWVDEGNGVPGEGGVVPSLHIRGIMAPGSQINLDLTQAPALACVTLTVGGSLLFDGLTNSFVPTADIVDQSLVTDATGMVETSFTWPTGPVGSTTYLQCRVIDPAAPLGEARSNLVAGTQE